MANFMSIRPRKSPSDMPMFGSKKLILKELEGVTEVAVEDEGITEEPVIKVEKKTKKKK